MRTARESSQRLRVSCASSVLTCVLLSVGTAAVAADQPPFQPMDVFALKWAHDPQISPDGRFVAYVRGSMDAVKDRRISSVHLLQIDAPSGAEGFPLRSDGADTVSPLWSPSGDRLLYVSAVEGKAQLFVYTVADNRSMQLTREPLGASSAAWSRDGKQVAFISRVARDDHSFFTNLSRPIGVQWAEPPRVITDLTYRNDGAGFFVQGWDQLFIVPAAGGEAKRLTQDKFNYQSPEWNAQGSAIYVSGNRDPNYDRDSTERDIYLIRVDGSGDSVIADRKGPDREPKVSPNGRLIAYVGHDYTARPGTVSQVYVANADGTHRRSLTERLDRDAELAQWSPDGRGLYFFYTDFGTGRVAYVDLAGKSRVLVTHVDASNESLPGHRQLANFSVSRKADIVFTNSTPEHPTEIGLFRRGTQRQLTQLNAELLASRTVARTEELFWNSSYDGKRIQGWVVYPPGFDAGKRYPLILEIHGGPWGEYGTRFAMDMQLYAAAGYVVLYPNPRGSSSYGESFENETAQGFPGHDYEDHMSGIDALLARGFVDPKGLFITGASGGGVMTAWAVAKTDRFRAAAAVRGVYDWRSFLLSTDRSDSDFNKFFHDDTAPAWAQPERLAAGSPISYVDNVKTPTLVMAGEADLRVPLQQSEMLYNALKTRGVDSALVRLPGASHHDAERPSQMATRPMVILGWFEKYRLRDAP